MSEPPSTKKTIHDYIAAGYRVLPKGVASTSAKNIRIDQHGNIKSEVQN